MKSFCTFAYATVIAVAVAFIGALAQHNQHQVDNKNGGDVVHWTTGGNTKGAAVLNHTGNPFSKPVTTKPTKLIVIITDSTVKATDAATSTEGPAATVAAATNGTSVEAGEIPTGAPAVSGASSAPAAPSAADASAAPAAHAAPAAPATEGAKTAKPIAKKK